MIIKVFKIKKIDEENEENNNFDTLAKNTNYYSLILHPQLKYLSKVISDHSPTKNFR